MSASTRPRPLTGALPAAVRAIAVAVALGLVSVAVHAQKAAAPVLADILNRTGDYLAQYASGVSGLECEETYVQRDVSGGLLRNTRQIKSDFYIVGEAGHVETF